MAGHVQGRSPYSSQRHSRSQSQTSQPSQLRKRPDSKALPQGSAFTQPDESSSSQKPKLRTSCDGCQEAKLGCSQEKPTCRRCLRHGIPCIYSPFRRIGRPRKSTNPRSATGAKSRIKKESVDESIKGSPIETLPELETDSHFGSMFYDPIPAPPSSPASPESGNGGSWYPWTADGNSLCNGLQMNLDYPNNLIDGTDPFSNTIEYLDLDTCLENHHNMFMDGTMSKEDGAFQGLGQSMQPTPPSSTTAEMMAFEEAMPGGFDTHGMSTWPDHHAEPDQTCTLGSPTSTSTGSARGLKLETGHANFNSLSTFQSSGMDIPLQSRINEHSTSQAFTPSPELTPPPSSRSSSAPTPCSKRCSSSLIKQLAFLNQHLSESPSDSPEPSLDTVLKLEKDAHSLCRKILTCTPCITNKSSYLLFSMILEHLMSLLETAIPREAAASESCPLRIGTFELDPENRTTFLKRYLLCRLGAFADVLRDFAQVIRNADGDADPVNGNGGDDDSDDSSSNYNPKLAKDMLTDVYRRLDSLRGGVEIWA